MVLSELEEAAKPTGHLLQALPQPFEVPAAEWIALRANTTIAANTISSAVIVCQSYGLGSIIVFGPLVET